MFKFFVLLTILLTFAVFSNVEAHDQSCYYLHLDGTVSTSNPLGQRLLTGSALVSQIKADAGPLGLNLPHDEDDNPLFRVDTNGIYITGGKHAGTTFEITGGIIQIDKDEINDNDYFVTQYEVSTLGFNPRQYNHSHMLYVQWEDDFSGPPHNLGPIISRHIGGFNVGLNQPVQCSNEGTYALWTNPDYDPEQPEGPGNQQYLNEEYLPGGSNNPNPVDILPTASVYMEPAEVESPNIGKEFTVEIKIKNSYRVGGFRAVLAYDGDPFRLTLSSKGDYIPENASLDRLITPATLRVSSSFPDDVQSGDGTLAEITFEVAKARAQTMILEDVELFDAEGDLLPVNIERDRVNVTNPFAFVYMEPAEIESPDVGEQFTVEIEIENSYRVGNVRGTVNFDSTALEFSGALRGDYTSQGVFPDIIETENSVRLAASFPDDVQSGDGTLATLTFEVVGAKASTISLMGFVLADAEGNSLPLITGDGVNVTVPSSEERSSDGQRNSVNSQQRKSNGSAGGEGDSDEAQQQKSNGSAGGKSTKGDSETSEQPSDDPSEEMLRSNGGNAPAAFPAFPMLGAVAWQVVTYDASGTVIRRVVGGVGQQSVVVSERQQQLMPEPPPVKTELLANYPNPFNPETWIPYHLAKASDVQITIYNARGVVVRQLDLGRQREGYYINRSRAAYWNGHNAIGERAASGLYFYQLQADSVSLLRKMVILK